jgi:hypothetical protein
MLDLSDLAGKFSRGLSQLRDGFEIPIPEAVVNGTLSHFIRESEEIEQAAVRIADGQFELRAVVRKKGRLNATLRFAVEEVMLDENEQWIELRQLSPAEIVGGGLTGRLLAYVITSVIIAVLRIDPVDVALRDTKGIEREGDRFRIDLAAIGLMEVLERQEMVRSLLGAARIDRVTCHDGQFKTRLQVDPRRAGAGVFTLLQQLIARQRP